MLLDLDAQSGLAFLTERTIMHSSTVVRYALIPVPPTRIQNRTASQLGGITHAPPR